MNQGEIIEMARQAGDTLNKEWLQRFAKLVEAKERDRMCKQCTWSKHENAACDEANQSKVLGKG